MTKYLPKQVLHNTFDFSNGRFVADTANDYNLNEWRLLARTCLLRCTMKCLLSDQI